MVLVGLANHADPDGRNAFPSNATLIRYTRLSERSVRSILRELASLKLIHPSDPGIVAAYISRADRRPNGYDLDLSLTSVDNSTLPVDNRGEAADHEGHSLPPADQHGGHAAQVPGADNASTGDRVCPRTVPEPSRNRPARARAQGGEAAPAPVPPPCGQCDARPGDTIAARTIPVPGRDQIRRCPRCHPHELASAPNNPGLLTAAAGDR